MGNSLPNFFSKVFGENHCTSEYGAKGMFSVFIDISLKDLLHSSVRLKVKCMILVILRAREA